MTIIEYSLSSKNYLAIFLMLLVAIVLTLVLIGLSYFLARQNPDSEKLSAYECGFEPYEDSRHVFDIRFYMLLQFYL